MGKLTDVIRTHGSTTRAGRTPDSVREFLAALSLPVDIQDDLCSATNETDAEIRHGCITVIASQQLQSLNCDALYEPWFDAGYFTIASGACGDPICIDLKTNRIVYILHEEMDHLKVGLVPTDHVIHTPLTYNQFWQRILDNESIPCDADHAEAEWGRPLRNTA